LEQVVLSVNIKRVMLVKFVSQSESISYKSLDLFAIIDTLCSFFLTLLYFIAVMCIKS